MLLGMETDMRCSMCFAAEKRRCMRNRVWQHIGLKCNTCGGAVDCCALLWLVCFRLVGSDADAVAWGGVTSPARMRETKCNVQNPEHPKCLYFEFRNSNHRFYDFYDFVERSTKDQRKFFLKLFIKTYEQLMIRRCFFMNNERTTYVFL